MKLYHGTSERHLEAILKEGIKPRGIDGYNKWSEKFPSYPDMVYLTSAYAPYFAQAECQEGERLLLLEVDIDLLDEYYIYPDEDCIAQIIRHKEKRALHVIQQEVHAQMEEYKHLWEISLEKMGSISHKGIIPPGCITRYCLADLKDHPSIAVAIIDPAISILNYFFCGQKYKDITAWFFGDLDYIPCELDNFVKANQTGFAVSESMLKQQKYWIAECANRKNISVTEVVASP